MPAGSVTARLSLDTSGFSAQITQSAKQMKKLADEGKETGKELREAMTRGRESVALLSDEIGVHLSRELRNFLAGVPGVKAAISAAFDVAAVVGIGGVLIETGERVAEFIKKVREMPEAINAGFRALTLASQTSNDELRLGTARMQEQIALLTGKRPNTLAEELADAAVAADKLADALDRDNTRINELLKQNHVGMLAGLGSDTRSTSTVEGSIKSFGTDLTELGSERASALQPGGEGKEKADELTKEINDKRQAALDWATRQLADAKTSAAKPSFMNLSPLLQGMNVKSPSEDANIAALQGFIRTLHEQQGSGKALADNKGASIDLKKAEDAKKYAEMQKQAQEAIVQQWQKALDQDKANGEVSIDQEAAYWLYRAETAKKGSLSYKAALDEAFKDIARINADTMRLTKETQTKSDTFDTTAGNVGVDRFDLSRGDTGEMKSQGQGAAEYLKNLNEGIRLQHENADAIAETAIAMQVATGQMSKLGAAQAMAALHAREYKDAMDAISSALEAAQSLPEGFEKQQRIAGLNNQRTQITGQRQIQIASDQQGISGETIPGAAKTALDQMVQSFTDLATNLKEVIPRTIEGLNGDIARLATGQGQKGDFGRTLKQSGEGLVNTGLKSAEGHLLSFISGGKIGPKRDGSAEQAALWVQIAGAAAGAPSSISTSSPARSATVGLASLIPGGSFIRPFIDSLIPHAGGGDVLAGHGYLVGERGPEPFFPGVSGTMLPNNAVGGGDTHIHVDARGSTDPAAVEAAVRRSAPHIVAASLQAHHSSAKRTPSGR